MSRLIAIALIGFLASGAGSPQRRDESAQDSVRQIDDEEPERAILGWKCDEGQVLPGGIRMLMQAPRISVPDAAEKDNSTGNHFVLYQDDPVSKSIEASVSWSNQPGSLDRDSTDIRLYFTIYGGPFRSGELIFESDDGGRIRIPVRKREVNNIDTAPPSTTITVGGKTAREFLKHAKYKVYHQGRSRLRRLEPLELFSFEAAAAYYAELLPRLARKLEDPARNCTPLLAPVPSEGDIV